MNLKNILENNLWQLNRLKKVVKKIENLSDEYSILSDEDLQNKTKIFKEKINKGTPLDDLLIEAFATVREADKRVLGLYPYPVQLMGGIVLHQGNLAEMKTGEGKTLTETMPVYLNALTGKGVHIVTVNEYLSQRDFEEMGEVFKWLGLTVGVNLHNLSTEQKQKAYSCDITYTTNSELAFDYLRDNMSIYKSNYSQRDLNYCIVDEADSVLIDEARTPLIIAGEDSSYYVSLYKQADKFVKSLNVQDYDYDLESKTVSLLPSGVKKASDFFPTSNLYNQDSFVYAHYVDEALKANYAMENNKDYLVKNGAVYIVDQFTGRIMDDRRYSDGLHQAIEAKEGVKIKKANKTEATITYQNFFRMYKKLAGMSGTAMTESDEFYETYHMKVVVIPTNRPIKRKDLPDTLYPTKRAKYKAVVEKIKAVHEQGQPILVGTITVEDSEKISAMLTKEGISHEVLNAKNNALEAKIIQLAGQSGAVTIATNMAGRGTDIKLGPGVNMLGGLFVLGTEKHESRRIDNQLRGRSGRQGDPGTSQFYLSLEDDLIRRYGTDRQNKIKEKIVKSGHEFEPIRSKFLIKSISIAQKKIEGNNFDQRKNTLRYDEILSKERSTIYDERKKVLNYDGDISDYLLAMFARTINHNVNNFCRYDNIRDYDGLCQFISGIMGLTLSKSEVEMIEKMSTLEIKEYLLDRAKEVLKQKSSELLNPEQLQELEKVIILKAVNENWKNNISNTEQLRQSITLRGYGQYNPLVEYQRSSFILYNQMLSDIDQTITRLFMRAKIITQ